MSDYLTRLVIRSFSPSASVQPREALAPGPDFFESFSDPFAEAERLNDEGAGEDEIAPQSKHSAHTQLRLEPPLEEARVIADQAAPAGPSGDTPSNPITPRTPEFQTNAADLRSHLVSANEPHLKGEPPAGEPPNLEWPKAAKNLTPKEKRSQPEAPVRMASGNGTPLTSSDARVLRPEKSEQLQVIAPTVPESVSQKQTSRSGLRTGKSNAHFSPREPLVTGVSTGQLMKKRRTSLFSPQNFERHSSPLVAPVARKSEPPAIVETVVDPITAPLEAREESRAALTTLIPKVSTQSLLPVSFKTRVNSTRGRPYETTGQPLPSETVVNVTIGRIEVRATPSQNAKTERRSKGPKVMDLDDYVRQRSRGNR